MKNHQSKWPAFPPDRFPYEKTQTNNLFLITGDSGVGKTTWCRQWVESARTEGWRVGGLLSLPVKVGAQKVAIDLVDLATDERRQLAKLRQNASVPDRLTTGKWLFDTAVLAWGNEVLDWVTAVDYLQQARNQALTIGAHPAWEQEMTRLLAAYPHHRERLLLG